MDATEAMKHCQAYLDGELAPEVKAQVDDVLARDEVCARAYEAQRNFHGFLKRACHQEGAAPEFKERMAASLKEGLDLTADGQGEVPGVIASAAVDRRERPSVDTHTKRGRWIWPASVAASVMLIAALSVVYMRLECPYLSACAEEHNRIMAGKMDQKMEPSGYLQFVRAEVNYDFPAIPDLKAYQLNPVGVGSLKYDLDNTAIPKAAFIRYTCEGKGDGAPVSLQFHPWKDHSPAFFAFDSGKNIWTADHRGYRIVCWQTKDGKVLCTAVSRRTMEQVIQIASVTRETFGE